MDGTCAAFEIGRAFDERFAKTDARMEMRERNGRWHGVVGHHAAAEGI